MPGILPMKVIKVGGNSQSRIAQACDRCRSKKIRCDGIRPCCSQCANVGFECKTSDKLSRRAFPRGYTESLEERVRVLEQEVRELKDLLDEKDEKIDMLSRIHSTSSHPIHQLPSPRRPSTGSVSEKSVAGEAPKDEKFKVQQSPYLLNGQGSDSYFAGTSSARTFIEAFKHKVQETGRSTEDIDTNLLLPPMKKSTDLTTTQNSVASKAPPRLVSDQLINVFFQEWAPLFPLLHRPTFLSLYEKYVADSEAVTDKAALAQLNLVFGIAALSSGTRSSEDLTSFEVQWKAAIDAIIKENSMATLQALVLAQIFCLQQGDYTSVLTYKGLSTSLSARLGLQQSQNQFHLGTLTRETRKKVFWTLYTVDCFTAVVTGLPKHIKDEDIQCEYPRDVDDEYVTERGFTPTLPGESTKISSALALFRAARILSKVLEEVFPAKASYDLSLKRLSELSEELDAWNSGLAPHLRLQFVQDKPSTGTITSRSPLLSLAFHYIRTLIHRPAICASLGSRSSSSMIASASSCKHMVQIIQLLNERGLSFSFCLNRDEVLVVSGFGLLFQSLNLDSNSKILRDNQRMVHAIVGIFEKSAAPCATEFRRIACSFLPAPPPKAISPHRILQEKAPSLSRGNSDSIVALQSNSGPTSSTRKSLKAIASRFTAPGSAKTPVFDVTDHRRATYPSISLHPHGLASQSVPSLQPKSLISNDSSIPMSRSEPARSPNTMFSRPTSAATRPLATSPLPPPPLKRKPSYNRSNPPRLTNLDYLSFGNEPDLPAGPEAHTIQPIKPEPVPTDWEKLLGCIDNGQTNIYDACYGGPPVNALLDSIPLGMESSNTQPVHIINDFTWNNDFLSLTNTETNTSAGSGLTARSSGQDSLLSFSTDEGGLGSGTEDFGGWEGGSVQGLGTMSEDSYRGIIMPDLSCEGDGKAWGGWDESLTL